MTKIKLCGLSRPKDIITANELMPDLIGFVFWKNSKRYVDPVTAKKLRSILDPAISAAGVFVDEDPDTIMHLYKEGIIDTAQLHGSENDEYIKRLRDKIKNIRIIKAFKVRGYEDISLAERSSADMILLDAGMGEGRSFDWELLHGIKRPYFLAGGLDSKNAEDAVRTLSPFGVDVSSGIETDGKKDTVKMREFVSIVRNAAR